MLLRGTAKATSHLLRRWEVALLPPSCESHKEYRLVAIPQPSYSLVSGAFELDRTGGKHDSPIADA